jgi:hypothetical protein
MTIAQTRKPGRQDLSQARGGTITGRGGRAQQLGAAAQRRLGQQPPAQPAKLPWQQLRDAGQQGTGSAAGNRAAAAGLPGGGGGGGPQISSFPMPPGGDFNEPFPAMGGPGGPGSDMGFQSGGGFMGEPMPMGGGMASYLRPGAIGQMAQGVQGAAGPMAGMQKPGVNSNPFAQVGGTPNGEPMQAAQGRAGQAGRIAQLIQRLRGGGQGQRQPMFGNVPPEVSAAVGAMY